MYPSHVLPQNQANIRWLTYLVPMQISPFLAYWKLKTPGQCLVLVRYSPNIIIYHCLYVPEWPPSAQTFFIMITIFTLTTCYNSSLYVLFTFQEGACTTPSPRGLIPLPGLSLSARASSRARAAQSMLNIPARANGNGELLGNQGQSHHRWKSHQAFETKLKTCHTVE